MLRRPYILNPAPRLAADPRAFTLPRASIRRMLILLALGSFVIVPTSGGKTQETTTNNQDRPASQVIRTTIKGIAEFDQVVTAFATSTGRHHRLLLQRA